MDPATSENAPEVAVSEAVPPQDSETKEPEPPKTDTEPETANSQEPPPETKEPEQTTSEPPTDPEPEIAKCQAIPPPVPDAEESEQPKTDPEPVPEFEICYLPAPEPSPPAPILLTDDVSNTTNTEPEIAVCQIYGPETTQENNDESKPSEDSNPEVAGPETTQENNESKPSEEPKPEIAVCQIFGPETTQENNDESKPSDSEPVAIACPLEPPQENPGQSEPSKEPEPESKDPEETPLSRLLSLQNSNGFWAPNEKLASALGVSEGFNENRPEEADVPFWATVLAVLSLYGSFTEQKEEWGSQGEKAVSWLQSKNEPALNDLVKAGNELLKTSVEVAVFGL
ncbi:protein TsetseEP-like [Pelobates fuscus]|uniref:protein TsetseEP-like n=1 Tax=Pelobates fuscus TaxID=191477 RepID=UPI002FE4307C